MVDRSLQIEVSSGCLAVMMVFWVFVAVFGHLDLCVGSNLTGSSADPFHTLLHCLGGNTSHSTLEQLFVDGCGVVVDDGMGQTCQIFVVAQPNPGLHVVVAVVVVVAGVVVVDVVVGGVIGQPRGHSIGHSSLLLGKLLAP
jgi:hypothetical protein